MIHQDDVDHLLSELEAARELLRQNPAELRERLVGLLDESSRLRTAALGGPFEASITCVHDLLQSVQTGLDAQDDLARARPAA